MTKFSNKPTIQIAPSLLSADFMNLEKEVRRIEADADWLHVDVMDGHFVPNLTIGPPIVKALKAITDIPLDVHLMIDNPLTQLDWFIAAGADLITIHLECAGQVGSSASKPGTSVAITEVTQHEMIIDWIIRVHAASRRIGLAVNPGTPAELVIPYLSAIDLVLVMSVHPGFGGQGFIQNALDKIRLIAQAASTEAPDLLIEVDGGINRQTAVDALRAGANLLVAGQAVFAEPDPVEALRAIRAAADNASAESSQPASPVSGQF